jgi:signal transduction histidine kinase
MVVLVKSQRTDVSSFLTYCIFCNAEACQEGGEVIIINTWQENDQVVVTIKDTGTGINLEDVDLIFQPFYSTKSKVKGTEMGPSVSYGIIKKQDKGTYLHQS